MQIILLTVLVTTASPDAPAVNAAQPNPDGDAVPDGKDNCPQIFNPWQEDSDRDGVGDACDRCPEDAADDADGDGLCREVDNCEHAANSSQNDADFDGIGDACDAIKNRYPALLVLMPTPPETALLRRMLDLPAGIAAAWAARAQTEARARIADPDEDWNGSCVIDDALPFSQLVWAYPIDRGYFVYLQEGTMARQATFVVFEMERDEYRIAWQGDLPGDFSRFKELVTSGMLIPSRIGRAPP